MIQSCTLLPYGAPSTYIPFRGLSGDSLYQDVDLPIEVLECRGQGSFSAVPLDSPAIDHSSSARDLLGTGPGPRQSLGRILNFSDPQVLFKFFCTQTFFFIYFFYIFFSRIHFFYLFYSLPRNFTSPTCYVRIWCLTLFVAFLEKYKKRKQSM